MPGQMMGGRLRILLVFFLAGAFSQVVQALMGREMLVVFYGNEIGLGLFYSFWLFWIALGSWAAGRLAARLKRPLSLFSVLLALLPAASAGSILLLRVCRRFIDVSPAQFVPLDQLALWSFIVSMPVGVLVGAVFPLVCRGLGKERDVPDAYIFDALGGLAGGVLFTFLFVDLLSVWQTLGALSAALGLSLLAMPREGMGGGRLTRVLGGGWALAGLLLLLPPIGGRFSAWADGLRWRSILPALELVESFDTPYQNIAIARLGSQTSIVADGKVTASFPEKLMPAFKAAFLYAQHPKARRVLLVGGAASGLIPELLRYPVERIDCVEQDREAFERIRARMPESWRKAFEDSRVRIHFADPRVFFNRFSGERYDLITAFVPDPATAQLNRLFTVEFYGRVRAALSEGGVFATEVTSASNYLGREVKSYNASVYRTLSTVFADVRATPGDSNIFFASSAKGRLSLDPAVLGRRYSRVRVRGRSIPPQAFLSVLPKERVSFVERSLREQGGELNTDLRPVTYYLNMLLWGRFSGSEWVSSLELIRRVGERFFLIPLAIFILFRLGYGLGEEDREREARFCSGLSIAALGFTAMALAIVLLFTYQSLFGSIYRKIALLNGLLMFGLAAGAFAAVRLGAERARRPGQWLLAAAFAAAVFTAILPRLLAGAAGGGAPSEPVYWLLVFAAGLLAGAGFPAAFRLYNTGARELGRSSGAIDSADHLGGMLGALVTGTCLVPLLGVERSCRLAAGGLLLTCLPLVQFELREFGFVRRLGTRIGALLVLRLSDRAYVSFPFKRLSWLLAGAALTVWVMSAVLRGQASPPIVEFSDFVLTEQTGLTRFELVGEPFPYYRGLGPKGRKSGASFSTFPHSSEVKGYSGPINLLLSLDEAGEIRGLKLIESRETPSYIEGIDAWLRGFRGRDSRKALALGKGLDGLSGATVTSRAVVRIVNRSSKAVGEEALGLEFERSDTGGSWRSSLGDAKFWAIALFLGLFFPVLMLGSERLRLVYLAGSVGLLGFCTNTLFTLIDAANLSQGRLPGADNGIWYLLVGFILVTSILWGQVYCGFVCPFGALQEMFWEMGRRLGLKSYVEAGLSRGMRYVKFVILPAALGLYWITERTAWITFNPMQHAFSLKFGTLMAILIATVLGSSLFYFRFWCRYFCPTGALLALFNKLALWRRGAPRRMFSLCDLGVGGEFDVDCIECRRCTFHPAYDQKSVEYFEEKGR
ncbi:MAG: 4Fe-4S binding protein [Elusimicrobiota bacterium]